MFPGNIHELDDPLERVPHQITPDNILELHSAHEHVSGSKELQRKSHLSELTWSSPKLI